MTETLHVGRMRVRYRAPHDDSALRRQLDGLLESVLDEGLEPALARNGVPVHEEICIRSVSAPARLRLDRGGPAAVAAWSAAIADAVSAALTAPDAGGGAVVRYRNRRAALVDLALGVSTGDVERRWAWRQLGLWGRSEAVDDPGAAAELVAALVRDPAAIVSVLAEVARAGTLPRLVASITPADWVLLARLALGAAYAPARALDVQPPPEPRSELEPPAEEAPLDVRFDASLAARAARILGTSALGRALLSSPRPAGGGSAGLYAAYAALAWLEAEPAVVAASSEETARAIVAAVAKLLAASDPVPPPAARELARETPPGAQPAAGDADGLPEVRDEQRAASGRTQTDGDDPARLEANDADLDTEASRELRRIWTTRHGGLLFLLGVADELGLPAELATVEPLALRPQTWALHRLGLTLTSAPPDDPAALAFAGLAPDAPVPDRRDPGTPEEHAALGALAGRIAEHLRERLDRPEASPDELLDLVCRRRGEILFDPGWIELRLPLDEVSPELRRAGLDLDPGWLPWLGAVVRFAYV